MLGSLWWLLEKKDSIPLGCLPCSWAKEKASLHGYVCPEQDPNWGLSTSLQARGLCENSKWAQGPVVLL